MKNYLQLSFTLLILLGLGAVLLLLGSGSVDNERRTSLAQSEARMLTTSVPLPESVDFCGERISLKRLDMRERFDREINSLTYTHSNTLLYFKRANRYFPMIEPILKRNNIPVDFKYLCVIESNLDTRALSSAKAAGLWQFMESTGKNYGLEINAEVDERYHIEKATEAACRYFRDAYSRYGSWTDVAASYNAGMGKISSAMNEQMVSSAFDLLLVSETSRYVFRIMALKQIFEHPRDYGFMLKKENFYPAVPLRYETISTEVEDWALFAKQHNINYMQLKDYNVWLRGNSLKNPRGKTYRIAIPEEEALYYDAAKVKIYDKRWVE